MSLEQSLVLNRYMHSLFGAALLEDLKPELQDEAEGAKADGHSRFNRKLVDRDGLRIPQAKLAEYDARVMGYEVRLAQNRRIEPFRTFKYFQYLALLYTEVFLDKLTENPAELLGELEQFRQQSDDFSEIPAFGADDLRRLAFFMATGSGKTLLLHVNVWQALHYLKAGNHPEALVRRTDGRREFNRIILITPGEGLSDQHLKDARDSGLEAVRLVEDRNNTGTFEARVSVIEIHKLAEEASGDGVSIALSELGNNNLVIVDEGHKGTGSEAKKWKQKQQALAASGFILEYSATFAQAINAAAGKKQKALRAEYGKAILLDYSYRYFYWDGFGKTFNVLNQRGGGERHAERLMLGGMLVFYQQVLLHQQHPEVVREYNIEKPLWVLLGTSVSKKKATEKDASESAVRERTDVAQAVGFLRKFLRDEDWAIGCIGKMQEEKSGFTDEDTGRDLFYQHIQHLHKTPARRLYTEICRELFGGHADLEICELKESGEIGLRLATTTGVFPYFGVINIGDVGSFKKHLKEKLRIEVTEDRFHDDNSLFKQVNKANSTVNLLIGAKKFIEGWSSWRVSSMALLNVGKGEGSQIIQLFGRGVRLKGKGMSLKRSGESAATERLHPWLRYLETLFISGWNADYVRVFRNTVLQGENVIKEIEPPLRVKKLETRPDWLFVPAKADGCDPTKETWVLDDTGDRKALDLTPKFTLTQASGTRPTEEAGTVGRSVELKFDDEAIGGLLDLDALHADLVGYKNLNDRNVFVPRSAPARILKKCCQVTLPADDAEDPRELQRAASRVLRTYFHSWVNRQERQYESDHAVAKPLNWNEQVLSEYRISVANAGDDEGKKLIASLRKLLAKPIEEICEQEEEDPLPRLCLDGSLRHLFNPIIVEGTEKWKRRVSVRPPPLGKEERRLVKDLKDYWKDNHNRQPFNHWELHLLRNLPLVGVRLFEKSGFFPDFILWGRHRQRGTVHVRFLEPHGFHHEGLEENTDRFDAFRNLKALGRGKSFADKKLSVDGVLLVFTKLDQIQGAKDKTWDDLERDYPLIRQDAGGAYIKKVLDFVQE